MSNNSQSNFFTRRNLDSTNFAWKYSTWKNRQRICVFIALSITQFISMTDMDYVKHAIIKFYRNWLNFYWQTWYSTRKIDCSRTFLQWLFNLRCEVCSTWHKCQRGCVFIAESMTQFISMTDMDYVKHAIVKFY